MPRIGMRIIKSALAVFICFLIYIIRGEGLPFYSTIAAIMCMQPGVSNTLVASRNRIIGTLVGGIFGMVLLVFERKYMVNLPEIYRFILISIAIIPLIYTTILVEQKQATHTTCIVFLSIVVNHATDISPYSFTISRVIDTLIGVFVALAVNGIKLPRKKNKDIMFITQLEDSLGNNNGQVKNYIKVKVNEMIKDGALITLYTNKTASEISLPMTDLDIKLPIITMGGASVYEWNTRSYSYVEAIDYITASRILDIIESKELNTFINTIVNDVIHIYYSDFRNPIEKEFYNKEKLLPMKNYIFTTLPKNRDVVMFKILETKDKISELKICLSEAEFSNHIKTMVEDYNEEYKIMTIFSSKACMENAIKHINKDENCSKVALFINNKNENKYTETNKRYNSTEVSIIEGCDSSEIVKIMSKLFYLKRKK